MKISLHKISNKKAIYLIFSICMFVLIVLQAFFETTREFIKILIFNPYWGIALALFEIHTQSKKDEDFLTNEKKLAKLEAVINDGGQSHDSRYLLAILKGLDGDISAQTASRYVDERLREEDTVEQIISDPLIE